MGENIPTEDIKKSLFISNKHSDDMFELGDLLVAIKAQKGTIFLAMSIALLLVFIHILGIKPVYQTTALIQVENENRSRSLSINEFSGFDNGAGALSVERILIRSRFVLQPVIERLGLNIQVSSFYYPIFGAFVASRYKGYGPAKPLFGLKKYSWGGERISVMQFDVPERYKGLQFLIRAKGGGKYSLFSPRGNFLFDGKVGSLETSNQESPIPCVKILINELKANEGTDFSVVSNFSLGMVGQLASNLKIFDTGKSYADEGNDVLNSGIYNVTLSGIDSERLPEILNAIIEVDIQKNIERKIEETKKTLDFLYTQSAVLKEELDRSETALSVHKTEQSKHGYGSVAGGQILTEMVTAEKSLETAKFKKLELMQDYTSEHPYVMAINKEIDILQKQFSLLRYKIEKLPKAEQKMIGLEREVKVKDQLYLMLLNKIQQLQITREGTASDVKLLSPATPAVQLSSNNRTAVFGALLFGFIVGVLIIILRQLLVKRADDPDYLESHLQIPLFAIVPYSRQQKQIAYEMKSGFVSQEGLYVLAMRNKQDMALEGIRGLRATLQLSLQEAKNNIVSILGASASIGKSFVTLNLAYLTADTGKKILLIDADMRKGKLHGYLKLHRSPGLAEVLSGTVSFVDAKKTINGSFDFLSTGRTLDNPADLLFGNNLEIFLKSVSSQYDMVIIDTPPVLAMADAVSIAKNSGINMLLVGAGLDNFDALEHTVKRFYKNDVKIDGLIFNNTKVDQKRYGYGKYKNYYIDYYGNKDS